MKKIILTLSLIGVFILAGCGKIEVENDNQTNIVNLPASENTTIEEQTPENDLSDENQNEDELVEILYARNDERSDSISIPHINIESEDVDKINEKFDEFVLKINEEDWTNGEKYFYNVNNGILTLVTESIFDKMYIDDAEVYFIDLKTNKVMSNIDVMQRLNITDLDYDLNKILKDDLADRWKSLLENEDVDAENPVKRFYKNVDTLELKLSQEKIYFDDESTLHVLFSVPYEAVPSGSYYIDVIVK